MCGRNIKQFSLLCNSLYEANVELSKNSQEHLETEEQIFSTAYRLFADFRFSNYIERIWTDANKYRTVNGSENLLTFLHIPSEKRGGFQNLFNLIHDSYTTNVNKKLFLDSLADTFRFDNIKTSFNL